jgi:hypothetical protein
MITRFFGMTVDDKGRRFEYLRVSSGLSKIYFYTKNPHIWETSLTALKRSVAKGG